MALWRNVGPSIYDDNKSCFCQNIPEKLHSLMDSLAVVSCQRSEQVTRALKATSEIANWNCRTLLSTNRQPALPPLPVSSETRVLEETTFPLNTSTNTGAQVQRTVRKLSVFLSQSVKQQPFHQVTPQVTATSPWLDWKQWQNPLFRADVIPQSQTRPKPCLSQTNALSIRSLSPSSCPALAAGIAALELPSLLHIRPKEQSISKLMKDN